MLNWYLMLYHEHFFHFSWAGNTLKGKTVSLSIQLRHIDMPELEGRKCGLYLNTAEPPIEISCKRLQSPGKGGIK